MVCIAELGNTQTMDAVLSTLKMKDYFEVICTRDDVIRLKPDPEIFITTAEKMQVPPSGCVVMEDAQKGIDAAHFAGMKSIAVPNIYTKDNDFSNATMIVNSLDEVTEEMIKEL